MTDLLRLRAAEFRVGDRVAGGTIVAYLRIGRGGMIYRVRAADGSEHDHAFDRRRVYAVKRHRG